MPFEATVVSAVDAAMGTSTLAPDVVGATQALIRFHVHSMSDVRREGRDRRAQVLGGMTPCEAEVQDAYLMPGAPRCRGNVA
jgi:hypothetical protein